MVTDPVADTLIRIKNGYLAAKSEVWIPLSNFRKEILRVLKKYDFIEDYKENERDNQPYIIAYLYQEDRRSFTDLKQISKPGRRTYVKAKNIPLVRNGFGIALVSTPQGVLSGDEAREKNIGGEFLAKIW